MLPRHPTLKRSKLAVIAIGVLVFITTAPVWAWGSDGHKIVAMLAEAQLTPAARKEVDRLLGQEPGATLASISTWADEHRNSATAVWHYVNFPEGTATTSQSATARMASAW